VARRRNRRFIPLPGDPHDLEGLTAWVLRYLESLRVRHRSPTTVRGKESDLRYFLAWAYERGVTRPRQFTRTILQGYQRYLFYYRKRDGGLLAISTQRNRLFAIRGLFAWLTREDVLPSNPASELEIPQAIRSLPRHVLTPEEAEAVLAIPDLADPLGVRDRALLEVLYATGIRRMELAGLAVYDLDTGHQTLRIRKGKGRKDRVVPLGERAQAWVVRYLSEVRPHYAYAPDDGTLFLTLQGEPFGLENLGAVVRRYVKAADLGKSGSCHLWRHTVATAMLENGADVRYIQELLGHSELTSTQIYTRVSIRKLQEVHRLTHPASRLQREPGEAREDDELPPVEPSPPSSL